MLTRQHSVVVRGVGYDVLVLLALNTGDHLARYLLSPCLCFLFCEMGQYKLNLVGLSWMNT